MKGRWESNINVWFRFIFSQNWNCAASLFPKQNYNILSPNFHIHLSVSDLYLYSWEKWGCAVSFLGIHKTDFQYNARLVLQNTAMLSTLQISSRVWVTCLSHVLESRVWVTCLSHVFESRVWVTCLSHVFDLAWLLLRRRSWFTTAPVASSSPTNRLSFRYCQSYGTPPPPHPLSLTFVLKGHCGGLNFVKYNFGLIFQWASYQENFGSNCNFRINL